MVDLAILCLVLLLPFIRTEARVTSPFGYICSFVGFMFVVKYLYNQWLEVPFLDAVDPIELATHFLSLAEYLGIAFCLALPFCNPRRSRVGRASDRTQLVGFHFTVPALSLMIGMPVFLVVLGFFAGQNPISNPLAFRQFIQSKGMFYLLSVYIFLLNVVSIYVPYVIIKERRRPSAVIIIAYVIAAVFALISGFASMIVTVIIAPLLFWSACFRKRVELGLIVLLPVVVAFTVVYRDLNLAGNGFSLSVALAKVEERPEAAAHALNRFDYLENFAKGERYLTTTDPDWGASLVEVLMQPVPRAIWPQKPENFSTSMTRQLLPQNLEIGVTANFNSLNEFVQAFGGFGVLIGGVILAFILAISYCVFDATEGNPYMAVYYVVVLFSYMGTGFFAGYVNDLAFDNFLLQNLFFWLFIRKGSAHQTAFDNKHGLVPSRNTNFGT
jgi:hypothetical protein